MVMLKYEKSDMVYRKIGKKYTPIMYDWGGFPAKGIWIVTGAETPKGAMSSQWSGFHIMKIGELPELYPFASMMMSRDELAKFITKLIDVPRSPSDLATEILKWMATQKGVNK